MAIYLPLIAALIFLFVLIVRLKLMLERDEQNTIHCVTCLPVSDKQWHIGTYTSNGEIVIYKHHEDNADEFRDYWSDIRPSRQIECQLKAYFSIMKGSHHVSLSGIDR